MPIVQAKQTQSLNPLPAASLTAASTPIAEGAGLAEARAGVGTQVAHLGAQAVQVGATLFYREEAEKRRLAEEARKRAIELDVIAATTKLASAETEANWGEHGYLKREGKDALGIPEESATWFERTAGEIQDTLTTPEAKAEFTRIRAQRGERLDLDTRRHLDTQMRSYALNEAKASVENSADMAIAKALDGQGAAIEMRRGEDTIRTIGKQFGLSQAQIDDQLMAHRGKVHVGIVERLLDNGETAKAQLHFDEAKAAGEIPGDQLGRLEHSLATGSLVAESQREADRILSSTKTASDALDAATALSGDGKDQRKAALRDAVTARIKSYYAEDKALKKTDEEATKSTVWGAYAAGKSLSQIQSMSEYRQLTGTDQAQLVDRMVAKANAESSRAFTEEGRAITREDRAEKEIERQGWSKYWELSNPDVLSKMTPDQLTGLTGEIGIAHVNRLQDELRKLDKPDKVREATLDRAAFNAAATDHGMNPKSKALQGQLGQIYEAAKVEIDRQQRAVGNKLLSTEAKDAITAKVFDTHVLLHNRLFPDQDVVAATVVTPDDRARAYVPIAKVPTSVQSAYAAHLRDANKHVSTSEMQRRIGHAYAIRMLGGTTAEINAALDGQ